MLLEIIISASVWTLLSGLGCYLRSREKKEADEVLDVKEAAIEAATTPHLDSVIHVREPGAGAASVGHESGWSDDISDLTETVEWGDTSSEEEETADDFFFKNSASWDRLNMEAAAEARALESARHRRLPAASASSVFFARTSPPPPPPLPRSLEDARMHQRLRAHFLNLPVTRPPLPPPLPPDLKKALAVVRRRACFAAAGLLPICGGCAPPPRPPSPMPGSLKLAVGRRRAFAAKLAVGGTYVPLGSTHVPVPPPLPPSKDLSTAIKERREHGRLFSQGKLVVELPPRLAIPLRSPPRPAGLRSPQKAASSAAAACAAATGAMAAAH